MVKAQIVRNKNIRFDPLKTEIPVSRKGLKGYLRSSSVREREIGCIAVANIKKTHDMKIIKLIVEKISDSCLFVKLAALQAAISLSQEHSDDFLRLGVLNLIDPILSQHFLADSKMPSSKQERKLIISIVQNSLYLLESLCQVNLAFFDSFQDSPIIPRCLEVVLAKNKNYMVPCLELLNTFAEENEQAFELIEDNFEELYQLTTYDDLTRDVKMNIILLISSVCIPSKQKQMIGEYVIFPCWQNLVFNPYSELVNEVIPSLNKKSKNSYFDAWKSCVKAQEITLKIITNLLAVENEETPIGSYFINNSMVNDIVRIASGLLEDVDIGFEAFPDILCSVFELQCAAFYCLQNLIINTDYLIRVVRPKDFWEFLFNQIRKISCIFQEQTDWKETAEELLDTIIKVLLCFSKKYGNLITGKNYYVSELCNLIAHLPGLLPCSLIGTLTICANEGITSDQARIIFNALFLCTVNEDFTTIIEVMNLMYDVFDDERFDNVLTELRILQMMKVGLEMLRIRTSKIIDKDLRARGEEAVENSVAFIKYKELHGVN
ncbi:unnamed protein product [Blepharisma stoltei]|uniref:SYO1-like TPR repeats domain-containing protein n=1 Tax=Blepharisma stoltei TaxID=1481888 RepID=A0AAU9K074_9CILI|nr:unnamed protein product [Blepharisma stoltei]